MGGTCVQKGVVKKVAHLGVGDEKLVHLEGLELQKGRKSQIYASVFWHHR